jgi:hypothetical protein
MSVTLCAVETLFQHGAARSQNGDAIGLCRSNGETCEQTGALIVAHVAADVRSRDASIAEALSNGCAVRNVDGTADGRKIERMFAPRLDDIAD